MAVPAVWRLINLLAFIEPEQQAKAHRRDACAPLPKSKSKLLLVLASGLARRIEVCNRERGVEAKLTHGTPFPRSEMFNCLRNTTFLRVVTVFRSTGTAIRHEFRLENRMEIFGCISNRAFLYSVTLVFRSVQA